ncbi:MAG: redoxin domain-containing protein [Planctomycetaceae bacterium]|nr:redoxin domain-containing protein [Planctomycetaceae bacterium]
MRPLSLRFLRRHVVAATLVFSLVAPARSGAQDPAAATKPAAPSLPFNPATYVPQVILPLLHTPQVQAELGIEGAKLGQLEQLFATVDGDWWRARNLPPLKQRAATAKVEKTMKTWLTESLPREKLLRLADLERRAQGGRVLLREDVAEVVGLEPAQSEKLLAAARATESAAAALGKVFQSGGGPGDLEKAALLAARERELKLPGDLLSKEQQKRWRELAGAPFDTVTLDRIYPMAPELAPSATWINSKPLTLADLRGKVVILHFYAFECVNCQRNLPIYAEWQRKYADKGMVVIGIQSPETEAEQDAVKVIAAAKEAGIDYPVVFDGDSATWKAWGNTIWPTVYVIDQQGYLRVWWQGELNWQGAKGDEVISKAVEKLLGGTADQAPPPATQRQPGPATP